MKFDKLKLRWERDRIRRQKDSELRKKLLKEKAIPAKLEKEFQAIQEMLCQDENQVPAYDRGAIGYMLHSFYNGCENIFRSIARFFENDVEAL